MRRELPERAGGASARHRVSPLKSALCFYLPALAFLLVILGVRLVSEPLISFDYMLRDPASITNEKFYIGIVSNAGLMVWSATAAVCLLSYFVLTKRGARKESDMFLYAGLLTGIFLLDDAFLLHEDVFPNYIDIPKNLVLLVYGLGLLTFILYFRSTIIAQSGLLMAIALLLLGFSMLVDLLVENDLLRVPGAAFVEDGTKFLGIVGWLTYFARGAAQQIMSRCNS